MLNQILRLPGSNEKCFNTSFLAVTFGLDFYFRLRRIGTTYTGSCSEDGENWTVLGEHIRDLSQVQVGLVAAQAAQTIPAEFDYFTLISLGE